MKREKRIQK